jgi:hypothetical protein
LTQTPLLLYTPAPAATTQPAFFKVQDLPENTTFTSYLSKTLIIKPVLLISPIVAIPASAPTSIPTSALTFIPAFAPTAILTFTPTFTILIVSTPALTELTPSSTFKIATALSLATYILTKP